MKTGTDVCIVNKGKADEKKADYTFPVLETAQELIEKINAEPEKTLAMYNAKVKTEARNAKALELQGREPGIMTLVKQIREAKKSGADVTDLLAALFGEPA